MSFTPIILLEGSKLVAAVVCADCAPPGKATAFNYTAYAEEALRRGPSPRWADHERVAEQLSPLPPAVCRDQPGFDARGRPLNRKGRKDQAARTGGNAGSEVDLAAPSSFTSARNPSVRESHDGRGGGGWRGCTGVVKSVL